MKSIGYTPDCGTCNYLFLTLSKIGHFGEAVDVLRGMGRAGCIPRLRQLRRLKNDRATVLEDGDEGAERVEETREVVDIGPEDAAGGVRAEGEAEKPLKGVGEGARAPALVADLGDGGDRIPTKMVAERSTIEKEWRARVTGRNQFCAFSFSSALMGFRFRDFFFVSDFEVSDGGDVDGRRRNKGGGNAVAGLRFAGSTTRAVAAEAAGRTRTTTFGRGSTGRRR
ncbi:hypothetical protein SASPL_110420 [Salvia splendens]|uniref:Pentatricopeptide repeat-containing protein n=1 Tax=Salvia splendens TaxID=180675 RepID=A0A8X8Y9Y0_SALSN|nr:hypothetical protein SASPL_110420 [Salvia splendens]